MSVEAEKEFSPASPHVRPVVSPCLRGILSPQTGMSAGLEEIKLKSE